ARASSRPNGARDAQVRLAVVLARLRRIGSLAAEALVAFGEDRLRRSEREVEREIVGFDARAISIAFAHEPPVVDPHAGVAGARFDEAVVGAGRALVVEQVPERRVRERRVREEKLARAEGAGIPFGIGIAHPEECDLEAERRGAGGGRLLRAARSNELAGHVPPFDAMPRVRAEVA